jgi:surfeit locus 1 family protein
VLKGTWVPDKTVFLDNRQMDTRVGFFVLTPLLLQDTGEAVVVQRGWIPRNFEDRTKLPPVLTPSGVVQVPGRIAPAPSKLYQLGTAAGGAIRQNLDLPQFKTETALPLLSITVQQTGEPSEGLLRDWPAVNVGVDKHYGYAFQWFGLAVLIALLTLWFQIVRRFIYPPKDAHLHA